MLSGRPGKGWRLFKAFAQPIQGFCGVTNRRFVTHYSPKRRNLSFSTLFHEAFNPLAKIFFGEGQRKSILSYFEKEPLSGMSLAYWFMDDGGLLSYNKDYPRRALVFNTQSFTRQECEILSQNINQGHDLQSWVKAEKGYYIIAIPAKRSDYLRKIMESHIIDSMKHKLRGCGLHKEKKLPVLA